METPPAVNQGSLPRTAGIAIASLVLGILSVTCLSILAGIPALICGAIAMQRIARSGGALLGKGQALAGLIMGGVSFAMLPFVLGIGAGLLLPAVSGARAKAQEAACMNHVRQCTLACTMYAQLHNNALPASLDDVLDFLGGTNAQSVLHCPATHDPAISYELVNPGKRLGELNQPGETILIREINATHRGKRVVAYVDGHVVMLNDARAPGAAP